MRRYLAGQRGERAALDALIRATPRPEEPTEDEKGEWNFSAPNRTDEAIEQDRARAKEREAKTNGMTFLTTPWIFAVLEHQGHLFAEACLDAVNVGLDPAKPEDEEPVKPKRQMPAFVRMVGVAGANPLPIANQIADVIRRQK